MQELIERKKLLEEEITNMEYIDRMRPEQSKVYYELRSKLAALERKIKKLEVS